MPGIRESKRVFALSSQTEWRLQVSKPLKEYKVSTLNRASVDLQREGSGGSEAQKLVPVDLVSRTVRTPLWWPLSWDRELGPQRTDAEQLQTLGKPLKLQIAICSF